MDITLNPKATNPLELFNITEQESTQAEAIFNGAIHTALERSVKAAAAYTANYVDQQIADRVHNGKKGLVIEINAPVDVEKECVIDMVDAIQKHNLSSNVGAYLLYTLGRVRDNIDADYQINLQREVNEIVIAKTGGKVGVGVATATTAQQVAEMREALTKDGKREFVSHTNANDFIASNTILKDVEIVKPMQCPQVTLPEAPDGCGDAPKMQISWTHGEA